MTALDDDDLSLADLLNQAREAGDDELHVATAAKIESYDAAAQVADVTPVVNRLLKRADGSVVREPFPTCRAVRLVWPRAGDWFLHMPLSAGDFVLLISCDRDLARWIVTGELSDPIDRRTHHLAHAVAIPGLYPATAPIGDAPTNALVLGKDGGGTFRVEDAGDVKVDAPGGDAVITGGTNVDIDAAGGDVTIDATADVVITGGSDVQAIPGGGGLVHLGAASGAEFVALAAKVLTELDDIRTKHDAHVHLAGTYTAGATAVTLLSGIPNVLIGSATAVAATKVKAT